MGKCQNGLNCTNDRKGAALFLIGILCLVSALQGANMPNFTNFQFIVEPSDMIINKERPFQLGCSIVHTNHGSPVYTWYKDGSIIDHAADKRYTVVSNGSLSILEGINLKLGTVDGAYQCKVLWEGQTILSSKAKVQMAGIQRTFDIEPRDVEVYLSDTAMFECGIISIPNANITWFKDGNLVIDQTKKFRTYTEGVLEINNVEFSDLGNYHCVAESADKTRRKSRDAKLSQKKAVIKEDFLGVKPNFTIRPQDTPALVGSKVILFCGAFGLGSDQLRPTITWLKNERTIDFSSDGRVSKIGDGNLQILDVKSSLTSGPASDDATYTCRAMNDVDSVDAEAKLTVLVPPTFAVTPQNMSSSEKSDIIIPCRATGNPKSKITWYKNGDPVIPGDYLDIVDNENLRILGLVISDSGFYQCFAENDVGNKQATMQLIVIQLRAYNTVIPEDVPSQPQKLMAALVSTRYVTLTWNIPEKSGKAEIIAYIIRWQEIGSERERSTNSTAQEVNINNLKPNTEYQFWVSAFNMYGWSKVPSVVKIKTQQEDDVPTAPQNITAVPLSTQSIKISWTPPALVMGSLLNYDLFYYVDGAEEEDQVTMNSTQTSYILKNLQEYQEYSVRVVANNANGAGVSTEEVVVRTFSDIPSDAPQNFTLETASSTSIVVRWQPPKLEHQNGKITGYKIHYKRKGAKNNSTITTAGDRDLYALTDLKKDTVYEVRIAAQTVNGSGLATKWETVKTYADDLDESDVPDMPDRLHVRQMTNSLIIQWVPNRRSKYLVRGYYLGYGKGIPDVYRQLFDANTFFHTIEDLQPASEYVVSIRAFNNQGEGQPRYETVFTLEETAEEEVTPMLPPIGLKAIVLSSHTIVLTWADSSLGKIQRITDSRYYTIRYTSMPSKGKYKLVNSTELVKHIDDLKPDTHYEFSVKVTKGRRKSTWSMAVTNKTQESAPGSIPRDLTPIAVEGQPLSVTLNWQPPLKPNGQITGYLLFYTTDPNKNDHDWVVEGVLGEKLSMTITGLTEDTTYYFKVQARNSKGYGPISPTREYKTPTVKNLKKPLIESAATQPGGLGENQVLNGTDEKGLSHNFMIIIIACVVGATFCIVVAVVTVFLCRRRNTAERRRQLVNMPKNLAPKGKDVKLQGASGRRDGQPPDLWIDHDKLELKHIGKDERAESSLSVTSARKSSLSSVQTNNPSEVYQPGSDAYQPGSDVEERLLPPSYHQLSGSQQRNIIRPKPLKLPVDAQTQLREPVAMVATYPNSGILTRYAANPNFPPSPSEDTGVMPMRPVYPRTQFQMQYATQGPPRVNAGDIANVSMHAGYPMDYGYQLVPCDEDDSRCQQQIMDDSFVHRVGYGGFTTPSHHGSLTRLQKSRTPITGVANQVTPTMSCSSADLSSSSSYSVQSPQVSQGHMTIMTRTHSPLKSFSVPDPPGSSQYGTHKHIVKPQQTTVAYKKQPPISSGPIKPRAMMAPPVVSTKSAPDVLKTGKEEDSKVNKSLSTEELTAEMANLEGLMKDLNAITQQDFEC